MAYWSHVVKDGFWQCPHSKTAEESNARRRIPLRPSPSIEGKHVCLSLLELMLVHESLLMTTYMQPVSPKHSPQPLGIRIPHTHQISWSVNPKGKAESQQQAWALSPLLPQSAGQTCLSVVEPEAGSFTLRLSQTNF